MDNSKVPIERSMNSSTDKVNKRRSLVFKRQSIVPKDQDLENTNITEDVSHESKKIKLHNESEEKSFDIKKYIESLKEEDKTWREVYTKRKFRVQDLLKRNKNQEQVQQTLDITCLSDSERAFIAAKPDYEEFNRNLHKLHAMTTKVSFLNLSAKHFYEQSLVKLQSDTDKSVDRMINLVD